MVKNAYAFVNLAMAAFVLSAVAVRFVFPAVSAEGAAFWIVRTSPVPMRAFLWSKFWTGLVPVLVLAEALTVASNELPGRGPVPAGPGRGGHLLHDLRPGRPGRGHGRASTRASTPRTSPRWPAPTAASRYMVLAVLFILVEIALLAWPSSIYLWHEYRGIAVPPARLAVMALALAAAAAVAIGTFWTAMQRGIRALERWARECRRRWRRAL